MGSLETVIAHRTGSRKSDVNERRPSLQLVVPVAVKEIGSADGDPCRCSFNGCKGRVIVYHIIGKENLLPASAAHIQSGKVIQRARSANSRKQPAILFVPETVSLQSIFLLRLDGRRGLFGCTRVGRLLFRDFLRACAFRRSKHSQNKQAEGSHSLRVGHFTADVLRTPGLRIIAVAPRIPLKKRCIACCRIRNGIAPGVVIPFRRSYLEI